jgi:probable F420-dependent oxidoreductase
MILDAALPPVGLRGVPGIACAAEEMGFQALWSMETMHDPFLPGALIAEHTQRLGFGTGVAVSFARSPATMAYTAWDLAQAMPGRFILGLGTQVKAHIERRFGMPWPASVVGKLREQILALRAFWHTWQNDARLDFRGEYYKLSLMSPFFNPGRIPNPHIPIYIAGVNTGLAKLAGEAADGFVVHPFHTSQYIQEVLLPAIQEGAQRSGRTLADVRLFTTAFVITSPEEELFVRAQVAFYASTPSYRPVMALHGWGEIAEQLSPLAARGEWGEMAALISDEMLAVFAVRGRPEELPALLLEKYNGLVDRLALYIPYKPGERDTFWRTLVSGLSAGES